QALGDRSRFVQDPGLREVVPRQTQDSEITPIEHPSEFLEPLLTLVDILRRKKHVDVLDDFRQPLFESLGDEVARWTGPADEDSHGRPFEVVVERMRAYLLPKVYGVNRGLDPNFERSSPYCNIGHPPEEHNVPRNDLNKAREGTLMKLPSSDDKKTQII